MKPVIKVPIPTCNTIEGLCDRYEELFGVAIPDSVFAEMLLHLGINCMIYDLEKRAASLKNESEDMKNED